MYSFLTVLDTPYDSCVAQIWLSFLADGLAYVAVIWTES